MLVFLRWMGGLVVAGVWSDSFWVCRHMYAHHGYGFAIVVLLVVGLGFAHHGFATMGLVFARYGSFFFFVVGFAHNLDLPQTPPWWGEF